MEREFLGMEDPDGNVYKIKTDETLTQSGIPADAAVGNKSNQLSQENHT